MRCYELESVRRFDDRAAWYARARPGYPDDCIRYVVEGCGGVVADLGAGTRISSRLLVKYVRPVIALDPNVVMLTTGEPDDALQLVTGNAESLPFRDHSVNLLTAFNAFHWFKPAAFSAEVRRTLERGGKLAVVWNDWNLEDPFTRRFVEVMRSAAEGHPPEDREAEVAPLYDGGFGPIEVREFANEHVLDAETLPMRMQSMSYVPKEGPQWDEMAGRLRELYERYRSTDGTVAHRYVTRTYVVRVD